MPVHERLFFAKSKISLKITDDCPCQRCSYNLRGLEVGGRCPECGTPISSGGSQRYSSTMSDAPLGYLERLSRATGIVAVGGGILLVGVVAMIFASGKPVLAMLACSGALLGACVWVLGIWQMTSPRETGTSERADAGNDWPRCRFLARASQAAWIPSLLCCFVAFALQAHAQGAFAAAVNANPGAFPVGQNAAIPVLVPVLAVHGLLLFAVALIGVAFVAAYMALLTDWAHDTALASRLRMAPFLVAIAAPLGIIAVLSVPFMRAGITGLLAVPIGGLSAMIFLGCVAMFVASVVQFASLCNWAKTNSLTRIDRDARMSDRISRRIELAQAQAEPAYVPPAWAQETRGTAGAQGNFIPSTEGDAIPLAPEEPRRP